MLRAILCCGNKLNFLDAKTIQYSSLSPASCKIGKKHTFKQKKQTQNRPKMAKRSVKQT